MAALDAHVRFRVETFTPLQRFDHKSFRELLNVVAQCGMKGACYSFGRKRIGEQTAALAEIGRQKLKKELQGQVLSITTDHWTSRRGHTYATLTAQYISQDFVLKNLVLGVYHYSGSTTADRMEADLKSQLQKWGIVKSATFIVTDTAANMNAMGVSLENDKNETIMEHIYCLDHVVQLVAKIAFDAKINGQALGTVDDMMQNNSDDDDDDDENGVSLLKKMRGLIGYFNRSSQAQETLEEIAKNVAKSRNDDTKAFSLVQDVVTRWWSTLNSIERLLKLKPSLIQFFSLNEQSNLKRWAGKKKPPTLPTQEEFSALQQLTICYNSF